MTAESTAHTAWLDRVRASWNRRAAAWDEMAAADASAADRKPDLDRTERALRLRAGDRLLDAGCGTGRFAIAFAQRGYEVTAVDIASAMIERARANGEAAGVEVDWRLGDISDFRAEPFAAIHAPVVLLFVPDLLATLAALARLLVPGGRLAASVPGALSPIYGHSWRRFVDTAPAGANFVQPWELETLLQRGGWSVVDEWGSFGTNRAGDPNQFDPATIESLPRRLRQAAATTWMFIAERPTSEEAPDDIS